MRESVREIVRGRPRATLLRDTDPSQFLVDSITMEFEVIGEITEEETFAVGRSIRERARLQREYGAGRWRKRKGCALIRCADGTVCRAELHWYEAHGIGRKELKIKRF